jgi:FKBP-type peptidyl-prolyl cis-trans isomerase (trigger factor)
MDTPLKLKMKIGEHEFEADGPAEVVQAQLALFKEMIANATPKQSDAAPQEREIANLDSLPHQPIEKIMKSEGRVVSLTAKCETVDEAVLLILLGQKDFRNNQEVTGSEIMDGLKQSGYQIERVDRVTDKLSQDGDMITIGVHRGRRYRLTNQGLAKALIIVKELIATVP